MNATSAREAWRDRTIWLPAAGKGRQFLGEGKHEIDSLAPVLWRAHDQPVDPGAVFEATSDGNRQTWNRVAWTAITTMCAEESTAEFATRMQASHSQVEVLSGASTGPDSATWRQLAEVAVAWRVEHPDPDEA